MKRRSADNAVIAALPAAARLALDGELQLREFGHGDVLYEPGAPIRDLHFPVDGVLSVITVMSDGSAVETATVGREGAVGLSSCLAPIWSHGRVIGQAPGAVFSAPNDVLRRLAAESGEVRGVIAGFMEATLAQAQQSVACNTLHGVEQRFCRWLLTCDDRVRGSRVELTQEFLAMMLGVQRTTVSQVASTLQAAGVIRYNRGRIDILDRPELERRACECYAAVRRTLERVAARSAEALTPSLGANASELLVAVPAGPDTIVANDDVVYGASQP